MNEKEQLPIIFWHRGNSDYLRKALHQAKKHNNNIILLGDISNKNFTDQWYNIDALSAENWEKFKRIYKNLSLNDASFE